MRTIVVLVTVGAMALAQPQPNPPFFPIISGPPAEILLDGILEFDNRPGGGSEGLLGGSLGGGRPGGGSGGLLRELLRGLLGGLLNLGQPGGGSGGGLLGGLLQGLGVGGGGGGLLGGLVNSLGLGNVLGPVDVRLPLKNLTDKIDKIIESVHLNTLTILFTGSKIDYNTYFNNTRELGGEWIVSLIED